ncbi:MAG: hypothetical protein WC974_09865 [Thermoplasmata archaeon]
MTYQGIINRVVNDTGVDNNNITVKDVAKFKLDLFDVTTQLLRIGEALKAATTYSISETALVGGFGELGFGESGFGAEPAIQEVNMETSFYAPQEVIFKNSDGVRVYAQEMQYEEYLRWNPNITEVTTSFNDIVTDATPQELFYTEENNKFDGGIGYCFTDTNPQKLIWKPAFTGTVEIYYSKINPETALSLSSSPDIHFAFHEAIVHGVTMKWLFRLLPFAKTEVQLLAYRDMVAYHKDEYKKMVADFTGWVNRLAETPVIQGFGFLQDPSMFISRGF